MREYINIGAHRSKSCLIILEELPIRAAIKLCHLTWSVMKRAAARKEKSTALWALPYGCGKTSFVCVLAKTCWACKSPEPARVYHHSTSTQRRSSVATLFIQRLPYVYWIPNHVLNLGNTGCWPEFVRRISVRFVHKRISIGNTNEVRIGKDTEEYSSNEKAEPWHLVQHERYFIFERFLLSKEKSIHLDEGRPSFV